MNFEAQINELSEALQASISLAGQVEATGNLIVDALREGNAILTCGNGGSAADALHMTEELTGKFKIERQALPAVCLNADGTVLTCIGNDFGFDAIFARQVEAIGKPGDILVGFSTSGSSPNVRQAMQAAKDKGLTGILLTSERCQDESAADHVIKVVSSNTERIQEIHTLILHAWLGDVDEAFA